MQFYNVDNPKNFVPKFFDETAKSYDKVAFFATFGRDASWKKQILNQIDSSSDILDLACGTGILTRMLAKKFPKARVTGIDITQSYLRVAEKNSTSFKNITYIHQDAEKLNLGRKFDCITSSYIPKYADPLILVNLCSNHLKSGGRLVLHDFTYPKNSPIQRLWDIYFIFLNFVGRLIPSWKFAFRELPKLIRASNWVTNYSSVMKKNGFAVTQSNQTLGTSTILVGKKLD